jgi:hypothetical protein
MYARPIEIVIRPKFLFNFHVSDAYVFAQLLMLETWRFYSCRQARSERSGRSRVDQSECPLLALGDHVGHSAAEEL